MSLSINQSIVTAINNTIIDDHNNLDSLIPQVLSNNNPALIEVVCDPNQEIFEVFKEM